MRLPSFAGVFPGRGAEPPPCEDSLDGTDVENSRKALSPQPREWRDVGLKAAVRTSTIHAQTRMKTTSHTGFILK